MALTLRELAAHLTELVAQSDSPDTTYVLWQYIAKSHIAVDISDDKWNGFVKARENSYADQTSLLASQLLAEAHAAEDTTEDAADDTDTTGGHGGTC